MKPAPFQYHAPETIDEAVGLLAEHGDAAKPLAGGQSLVPMLALRLTRFEHLVDLERVGALTGIEARGGTLRIGAMTRQRVVERSAEVARAVPLLARAVPLVGHFQIRNRGTIGGSLAHADPASELPAVALALDATMEITGPAGTRPVPAADFFLSTWTTAVADDELLTAINFPARRARSGFAVEEVARRAGDFALVGIAGAVELDDGDRVARVALARFGLGPSAQRAPDAEAALTGTDAGAADVEAAAYAAVADANPTDDLHASGHYRRQVGAHLAARVLAAALAEARGA